MSTINKICHITTVHSRYDIRIFHKQVKSLALHKKSSVILLVADQFDDEKINNIQIKSIGKPKGRLNRATVSSLKMLRAAKTENADVYHIHDPELYWLLIPLRLFGKKVILDLHEDLPSQILSKPYLSAFSRRLFWILTKFYENILFRFANHIITATPHIRDINYGKNNNITCISNYPISTEFKPDYSDKGQKSNNEICYTGGITTIRGIGYLIDSVMNYDDNWVLNLAGPIGDKEIESKLEAAIATSNRIKYWGQVSREELKKIFSRSSIGLVPFLDVPNHINAVPNKLFEYMSSGIPILCSNFQYWRKVINESGTGWLINPNNAGEIREAVNGLLSNHELLNKMGQNGLEAVRTIYNWENESKKLIDIYDRRIV